MFVCSFVCTSSLPLILQLVLRTEFIRVVRDLYRVLCLILIDPEVYGMLALDAGVCVRGEPLLEWDTEDLHINQVRVTLRHHPDVVSKDNARDEVDEVVSSQCNHQHNLHNTSSEGEPSESVPTESVKF